MNQNQTRSMSNATFTINRRHLLAGAMGAGLAVAAGGVLKAGAQATPPAAATANAAIGTSTKFNLNTITNEQILTIPSAGNQMTREFAEYRPWTSIPQFRQSAPTRRDGLRRMGADSPPSLSPDRYDHYVEC